MEVHRKDGEIENRPVSKGGKLFDALTYVGIAGVGTFIATIPTANMFNPGGKLHFIDQGMRRLLPKIGASKALADEATNVTNLMWGGNLMLIPVSIMEHYRTPIVKGLNRLLNDPTDPQSIEDAPPQTIGSILKARLFAWGTVFAGFSLTRNAIGKENYENLQHLSGEAWAKLRRQPIDKLTPNSSYNVGRTGALDVLATISSATLLYTGSHFFAKRAYEHRVTKDYLERKRAGTLDTQTTTPPTPATDMAVEEKPSTTINAIQRDAQMVAPTPLLDQPQLSA